MRKISNPFEGKQGYNCFGCCKDNPIGVHMDFYEDGDDIVSFWKPDGNYQGWVNVLHGGIQATLMDEIAGWVVFRKLQLMGVTSKLEVKYKQPVLTTELQLTLRGRILKQVRNLVTVGVTLENSHGRYVPKPRLSIISSTRRSRRRTASSDAIWKETKSCFS